jgi:cystathionine beta-lyase
MTDGRTTGLVTPLYSATAFAYLDVEDYAYPRNFNTPNQKVLVEKICALEGGEDGLFFSSGMGAIYTTLIALLSPGDHAIFQNDIYGGTHYAITAELRRMGINYTFIDKVDKESLDRARTEKTKLVYIETPSNPLLTIIDIQAVANWARENSIISCIDNTFASPVNQNPITFGIDVVFHSATKYLGGHSDISAGAVVSSSKIIDTVRHSAVNMGGNLNAQMCHLLERSMKTLHVRVRQQNANAMAIAKALDEHEQFTAVYYPGLVTHPDHDLAKRQMHDFGAMLSFEVSGDPDAYVNRLSLIAPAMSLGGVESTITSPRLTSHAKPGPEARKKAGISDNLLRLSVGIEEADDLIKDLIQALG